MTVDTRDKIRWTDAGAGHPVVLVHGWGGGADQWSGVIPALAAQYRVIAVNLPNIASVPDLGGALANLLTELDISDAVLVGHSLGGPIAIETALAAPDRVAAILGLDTFSDNVFYGGSDEAEIARRRAIFSADVAGETAAMVRAICAPETSETTANAITNAILTRPEDYLSDLRDAMFAFRIADRFPRLACPVRALNSSVVISMAAADPIPQLADMPVTDYGAGHFPQIEGPDHLIPLLLAELKSFDLRGLTQ